MGDNFTLKKIFFCVNFMLSDEKTSDLVEDGFPNVLIHHFGHMILLHFPNQSKVSHFPIDVAWCTMYWM